MHQLFKRRYMKVVRLFHHMLQLNLICLVWYEMYMTIRYVVIFETWLRSTITKVNNETYKPLPIVRNWSCAHSMRKIAQLKDFYHMMTSWNGKFTVLLAFVRGIYRSPVNSPYKGQWCGALMCSLIGVWIYGWVNNREAGDLKRYRAHYDVMVMQ